MQITTNSLFSLLLLIISIIKSIQSTSISTDFSYLDISYKNITSNLIEWNNDMAIMFYAPWCKYCKQLSPSWMQISAIISSSSLTVGTFNCELDDLNTELCGNFGVDRYPSLYFIGYDTFYQQSTTSFKKDISKRIIRYNSDIYPEALLDWINLLSTISSLQRRWDDFKGLLTGNNRKTKELINLRSKVQQLEKKVELLYKVS